jgi:hypothetical protein
MASVYRNALTSQSQLRTVTARTWLDRARWHSLPDAISKQRECVRSYSSMRRFSATAWVDSDDGAAREERRRALRQRGEVLHRGT